MRNAKHERLSVAVLLGSILIAFSVSASEFGYYGDIGPDFWRDLDPAWETCENGTQQSPVDLWQQRVYPRLVTRYDDQTTGEIFNNGHTIEVEITEGNNTLTLDGTEYALAQFHFHTASEHRVEGRGYDMELHLVHTSAGGQIAVIGVFLKRGDATGALEPIFTNLPDIGELNVKVALGFDFDPQQFLPSSGKHYRYSGSLTTPPCTEGVKWVVMKEPVTILDEDLAQFAARISFNARYTQRMVPSHRK